MVSDGGFGVIYKIFSLAAISTSFIGCSLSMLEEFSEFLRNLGAPLSSDEDADKEKLPLYLVILLPPLLASVFGLGGGLLSAVGASGGYGDPLLFGLLPVVMAWKQRYEVPNASNGFVSAEDLKDMRVKPLLPGGKVSLGLLGAVTIAMLFNKMMPMEIPEKMSGGGGGHF